MAKMNKNYNELLEEAKLGKISTNEINYVAQKLNEKSESNYTLIHILGKAKAIQYRNLIEPFLNYPDDPLVSKIALQCLCTYWDLTNEFSEELKIFIRGEDWDDFDDVRLTAIGISGEYLRSTSNKDLLHVLVDVFENLETSPLIKRAENPELVRSCAYYAIARALGKNYDQIPNTDKIINQLQRNSLDLSLIEQAKNLL
ncbi:MAG: hypothetical protein H0V82_02350 [Candidatus Protochlamydia sp.]|nr:hypothetical protein [Candidatus Protochlamydia sp.]